MQRYFFHVVCTDDSVPDYLGSEMGCLATCHQHALRIIRDCISHLRNDPRRWWIEVADQTGSIVMVVLIPRHVPFGQRADGLTRRDAKYWSQFLSYVCASGALNERAGRRA